MVTVNSALQSHLTQPLRKEISSTRCPGKCPVLPMWDLRGESGADRIKELGRDVLHVRVGPNHHLPQPGDLGLLTVAVVLLVGADTFIASATPVAACLHRGIIVQRGAPSFRKSDEKIAAVAQDALRVEHESV